MFWIPNWSEGLVPLNAPAGAQVLKNPERAHRCNGLRREEQTTMLFERPDVKKVLAMTGCLLSMTVIASIILNGARPPL